MDINIPKGLRERPPENAYKLRRLVEILSELFESYGYRLFIPPTYEHSDLFVLRSGEEIRERMFVFPSKSGRKEYALRPEVTAQIARSVALGRLNYPRPFRLYYIANVFRYEEPQRGRYREFRQAGVELIGSDSLLADAETIELLSKAVEKAGVDDFIIGINDVSIVKEFLKRFVEERYVPAVLTAIDRLRSLMRRGHRTTIEDELRRRNVPIDASKIKEFVSIKDPAELETLGLDPSRLLRLFELLEDLGAKNYAFEPTIVRGLEYYTSIVYELDVPRLGGASQVAGGGRYDELIADFGGPREPCVGFAIGLDRLLEASNIDASPRPVDIVVIPLTTKRLKDILWPLREEFVTVLDVSGRKLKKALVNALKLGAKFVVIVGEQELRDGRVIVRDLRTRTQEAVKIEEIKERIKSRLRFLKKSLLLPLLRIHVVPLPMLVPLLHVILRPLLGLLARPYDGDIDAHVQREYGHDRLQYREQRRFELLIGSPRKLICQPQIIHSEH